MTRCVQWAAAAARAQPRPRNTRNTLPLPRASAALVGEERFANNLAVHAAVSQLTLTLTHPMYYLPPFGHMLPKNLCPKP